MAKVYRTEGNNLETEERLLNLGELVIDNLETIQNLYYNSLEDYQEAQAKFSDNNYEEDWHDTLERKYNEGYSDALAYILTTLKERI